MADRRTETDYRLDEIEDEALVRNESFQPYTPFGSSDEGHRKTLGDFVSLAHGAEVVEVVVESDTPLEGETARDAEERGRLRNDTPVSAVERGGAVPVPRGETTIRAGDALTPFSRSGVDDARSPAFSTRHTADRQ